MVFPFCSPFSQLSSSRAWAWHFWSPSRTPFCRRWHQDLPTFKVTLDTCLALSPPYLTHQQMSCFFGGRHSSGLCPSLRVQPYWLLSSVSWNTASVSSLVRTPSQAPLIPSSTDKAARVTSPKYQPVLSACLCSPASLVAWLLPCSSLAPPHSQPSSHLSPLEFHTSSGDAGLQAPAGRGHAAPSHQLGLDLVHAHWISIDKLHECGKEPMVGGGGGEMRLETWG